jgi:NhaC family Na+:H+ antiporter
MSGKGISAVKNILFIFLLIGMITAVWRACGTIPFIIYYSSRLIVPSAFILITFLLCSLISTLTGTAFGTVATVGVICMTIAKVMDINPVFVGGAILSGIYFGDRCSPMSTSALLVSELTKTDIYRNIRSMIRTSIVPFAMTCILYLFMGMTGKSTEVSTQLWNLFTENFDLHWVVVLPAVLIIVLSVLKMNVKSAMTTSILAGSMICLLVQNTDVLSLLKLLVMGFHSSDQQLASMMDGGGVVSMLKVAAIVCFSSSYAGIFEGTGLLNGIKERIIMLSGKITPYGSILLTSVITGMAACNQTLTIMLTHQLCKETVSDQEEMAIILENTAVVIPPLIPWSIASAVPLAAIVAPNQSIFAASYLYLLPLWNLCSIMAKNKLVLCDSCPGQSKQP